MEGPEVGRSCRKPTNNPEVKLFCRRKELKSLQAKKVKRLFRDEGISLVDQLMAVSHKNTCLGSEKGPDLGGWSVSRSSGRLVGI